MSSEAKKLPTDPTELREFAHALLQTQTELLERQNVLLDAQKITDTKLRVYESELYAKTLHIEKLKFELTALRRARFGRSSEKLDHKITQMELALGDLEETQAEAEIKDETKSADEEARAHSLPAKPRAPKKPSVRRPLPEHLPRVRVEHSAACLCPNCGSSRLRQIGVDEREVLNYVPAHFEVQVHSRPKLSCRDCEQITQAQMPSLPIERGLPSASLLAHVLIAKFDDHLPLYRQSEIYARDGVDLDRSTLADWVGRMAWLLRPLAEAIRQHLETCPTLHADDTPVPVLDPGRGRTKTGRLWVALRDERPWGSEVPPAVFYQYAPDRTAERAAQLLKNCSGFLHADAYSGFNDLYALDPLTEKPRFTEVGCWAHVRRKIYEVYIQTKSAAAHELLEMIRELFAIEAEIKGQKPELRLKARHARSAPLLDAYKIKLDETLSKIPPKGTLAAALRYNQNLWAALVRYTTDGRLEISNNAVERAIRPVAVGKKNWLFAGSDVGGERAAIMYTLIETAKLNGVEPEAYLTQVIGCIADHPAKKIDELLPWSLKTTKSYTNQNHPAQPPAPEIINQKT